MPLENCNGKKGYVMITTILIIGFVILCVVNAEVYNSAKQLIKSIIFAIKKIIHKI